MSKPRPKQKEQTENKMSQETKEVFASIKKANLKSSGTYKKSAKTYTETEIFRVMEMLAINKFNYQQTSRETGVDRKTLRAWHHRRQLRMIQQERTEEVVKATNDIPIEQLRENYERSVIATKEVILKQMVEALPICKSAKVLADTLKLINDSIGSKESPRSPTDSPPKGSVLQILANQLNIKTDNNG